MWHGHCLNQFFHPDASSELPRPASCRHVFNQTSRLNPKSVAEVVELVKTTSNKSIVSNHLLTFSEFLQTKAGEVCIAKGDYHSHIANWLTVIKRDQVPHPYHLIYIYIYWSEYVHLLKVIYACILSRMYVCMNKTQVYVCAQIFWVTVRVVINSIVICL